MSFRIYQVQDNRWKWTRRVLEKLQDSGHILAEPINDRPSLGVQPRSKFLDADYICIPLISELDLEFKKDGRILTLSNVVEIHKWIYHFHLGPRRRLERLRKKISEYKRFNVVRIVFRSLR